MNLFPRLAEIGRSIVDSARQVNTRGAVALACWTVLIILGTWYPSTAVFKHLFEGAAIPAGLGPSDTWISTASMMVLATISWTWTNLAFVCIAASVLGVAARSDLTPENQSVWSQALPRAFVIYLACLLQELALRGGLIPTAESMGSGDAQQHYLRLAVLSSVACFAASFRPAFFDSMVDKLIGTLENPEKPQPGGAGFMQADPSTVAGGYVTAGEVAPKVAK